jgi:general secretion pathway protein D
MNLKPFTPLLLLLLMTTGAGAQSDSRLDRGWQVAQVVQVPPRRPPAAAASTTPAAAATTPAAAGNTPAVPPVPGAGPALPKLPAMPAVASTNAAGKSNELAYISYNFPAIPVEELLDEYAELVGRTILRSSGGTGAVSKDATITLKTQSPLTRTEAIAALEMILGMNQITIVPIGDKFAKVVVEAQAGMEGGLLTTNTNNLPESGKMLTQIVQIKYTDIKDLSEVLQPFSKMPKSIIALPSSQTLILRDYAENVNRMVEMVKRIDVQTTLTIKPEVIPIRYALASDIASALSALGAQGGTGFGRSTSGTQFGGPSRNGLTTGGMNSGFGGGNGFIGGTGSSFGNSSVYGQANTTSPLGSAATSGRSSFQQNLNRIVQNAAGAGSFQLLNNAKIIADERTNSLLVFANAEDMKMIKDIISKLDVVLQQVLIDAIIMEINLSDTQSTGVSYLAQRQGGSSFTGAGGLNNLSSAAAGFLTGSSSSNSSSGSSAIGSSTLANLPGGFSYFAKFGNDLNVVMEAIAGDSRINVLSRPRIQTSHAVPASLFIGNTVPYVTGTYSYYGGGPSSQYSQLQVGINLQVTPLINPDGLVVMDIQADVEQLGPSVQISGVGAVPTTTKRTAGAKVAVLNGETIILGGFISDSRSTSDSGIPGFKDIPLLGNLFKSRSIQNLRTELIMLMRPTVLANPEYAAIVATRERNKLSGVRAAELDIEHEQEDRNAALEKEMLKDAQKRAEKEKKAAKKEAEEKAKHHSADIDTNAPTIQAIPPLEK